MLDVTCLYTYSDCYHQDYFIWTFLKLHFSNILLASDNDSVNYQLVVNYRVAFMK